MAAVAPYSTRSPSATYDRGAVILNFICGEAVSIGDAVYQATDNTVKKTLGTTSAKAHAIGIVVGVTNFYSEVASISGQYVAVCVHGLVFGWTGLTDGEFIYISKTAGGGMVDAAPTGGVYSFVIGNAVGADAIFVRPGQTSPASTA